MTYEELAAHIDVMDDKQKKSNVTACIFQEKAEEFFPIHSIDFCPADDVLEANHPFLIVETGIPTL